jgi:hypothetical protein
LANLPKTRLRTRWSDENGLIADSQQPTTKSHVREETV